MRITNIVWSEDTILHIARHGVEPGEVEGACFRGRPIILKTRFNRYVSLGKTENGRYLTIIFEYIGQGKAKVITARAMSESERRLYKKG